MKKIPPVSIFMVTAFLLFSLFACSPTDLASDDDHLSAAKFLDPPLEARPSALWPWLNGYVESGQITTELEEMKAKGMRGAIIWDIGSLADPDSLIPAGPAFLGEESLKSIHHAIDEATRLGLELGLFASSSWNAGGAWIGPEDASKALLWSSVKLKGPLSYAQILPLPVKTSDYFFDVAVLAIPVFGDSSIPDPSKVINLTDFTDQEGRLTWDVPAGEWQIMRFLCSNTGQRLECPSPKSDGLVIDHLNSAAAEKHFSYILKRLMTGRPSLGALKFFMLDSYEVWEATDWTPDFIDQFESRYGYDPTPYLPVLAGWQVADKNITARFLYDWSKTVGDLIVQGHFIKARHILNEHGLSLLAEAGHGGSARVDPLKALGAADIPMGEFWNHKRFWVTKEAASAAHIYGRKFVSAEALTGWQHWQDGPQGYKRLFDIALCAGLNQVTFHTFAHNPKQAGLPGFAYHAGEHFNINTTWWNDAKPMLDYMSRCCYILQQGRFVADVCFYYGDQAPNLVPSRRIDPSIKPIYDSTKCFHCGKPKPVRTESLGPGYDYDYVNEEILLKSMKVSEGKIVLPGGMRYQLLVLPEREDISLDALIKIGDLAEAGATVVGPKPSRSNSLKDYPACDLRIKNLADKIWGDCDGQRVRQHPYGEGRIIWNIPLNEVLAGLKVMPDFQVLKADNQDQHIDYIHRETAAEDIYFICNSCEKMEDVSCTFRVAENRVPYLWNPENGRVKKVELYRINQGTISLNLKMLPVSSIFVVFKESTAEDQLVEIRKEESELYSPKLQANCWDDIEIVSSDRESLNTRIWFPGTYIFKTKMRREGRVKIDRLPGCIYPDQNWVLAFPAGWGAPDSIQIKDLHDWTTFADSGIRYFSGKALYKSRFTVPDTLLAKKYSLYLDLGEVKEVAEVLINGQKQTVLWKNPYRLDISAYLRPGTNLMEIYVTNLWNNRIVGDVRSGNREHFTSTNIKYKFKKDSPLLPSGLLGPVVIRPAVNISLLLERLPAGTKL